VLHNDKKVSPTGGYDVCINTPNLGAPKYIKHLLTDLRGEIDSNTIIVGTLIPHLHNG